MNTYIYQASLYCEDCTKDIKANVTPPEYATYDDYGIQEESYDSDDYPKGPYPDGGGEADSPQHCDSCRVFLENPLTDEGRTYVAEHPNREWFDFYQHDGVDWYAPMTGEQSCDVLNEILFDHPRESLTEIVQIDDLHAILHEHYNDDILERWLNLRLDAADEAQEGVTHTIRLG